MLGIAEEWRMNSQVTFFTGFPRMDTQVLANSRDFQLCQNTECSREDQLGARDYKDGWWERERERERESQQISCYHDDYYKWKKNMPVEISNSPPNKW